MKFAHAMKALKTFCAEVDAIESKDDYQRGFAEGLHEAQMVLINIKGKPPEPLPKPKPKRKAKDNAELEAE